MRPKCSCICIHRRGPRYPSQAFLGQSQRKIRAGREAAAPDKPSCAVQDRQNDKDSQAVAPIGGGRRGIESSECVRALAPVLRSRQTIHSIVCGRAGPGHPRSAAHALPVFVDARHKAGHERTGEINHLNGSEHQPSRRVNPPKAIGETACDNGQGAWRRMATADVAWVSNGLAALPRT